MGAFLEWEKGAGGVCAQQMRWHPWRGKRTLAGKRGQKKVWVPHLPLFLVCLGFCLNGLIFKAGGDQWVPQS